MRKLLLVAIVASGLGCATAIEDSLTLPHDGAVVDGGHDASGADVVTDAGGGDDTTPPTDSSSGDTHVASDSSGDATDSAVDDVLGDTHDGGDVADTTDAGSDTRSDSGTDVGGDTGATTFTFPSTTSTTHGMYAGDGPLGVGGSTKYFYVTGDYVEEAFTYGSSITGLDVDFKMYDGTSGCAVGAPLTWAVKVNGTSVGTFTWNGGGGDKTITKSYSFAAIAPAAGKLTLRYEATTTVCSGGTTWGWYPGGSAKPR